jgi:hypothetical protein
LTEIPDINKVYPDNQLIKTEDLAITQEGEREAENGEK